VAVTIAFSRMLGHPPPRLGLLRFLDTSSVVKMQSDMPGLEVQPVLGLLEANQPGQYNDNHLRTRQFRAKKPLHRVQ
jgi:hypothetical protein